MKKLALISGGFVGASLLAISLGVASAATSDAKNSTIGTSNISQTVFAQENLDAEATVLNTATTNVQAAQKNKTFNSLLTSAGLTKKTYTQKLKAQLTTDLESMGYSQDQVTIALQHRTIIKLHQKIKQSKNA